MVPNYLFVYDLEEHESWHCKSLLAPHLRSSLTTGEGNLFDSLLKLILIDVNSASVSTVGIVSSCWHPR